MIPVRRLLFRYNPLSFARLESDGGILPLKLLLEKDNNCSEFNSEMDDGMLPVSPLLLRFKTTSCVKSPISLGIVRPFTLSPALLRLSKLYVARHSVKDGRPINSHAICSGVK